MALCLPWSCTANVTTDPRYSFDLKVKVATIWVGSFNARSSIEELVRLGKTYSYKMALDFNNWCSLLDSWKDNNHRYLEEWIRSILGHEFKFQSESSACWQDRGYSYSRWEVTRSLALQLYVAGKERTLRLHVRIYMETCRHPWPLLLIEQ